MQLKHPRDEEKPKPLGENQIKPIKPEKSKQI
jgi:hypothetical protein